MKYTTLLCLLLLATACAPLGQQEPLAEAVTLEQLGLSVHTVSALISPVWWTQLNDTTLNQLILLCRNRLIWQSPQRVFVKRKQVQI